MAAHRNTRGIGWVGGCLIVVVLGVVVVGGLGFFGVRTLLKHGTAEVMAAIQDNPVVAAHIGKIESVEFNIDATNDHLTGADMDAGWTMWTVKGTTGEALLRMQFTGKERNEEGQPLVSDGILLKDGKEYPLFPDGVPTSKKEGEGPGKPDQPSAPEKPAESLPNPK
jgi:hypothetical protein